MLPKDFFLRSNSLGQKLQKVNTSKLNKNIEQNKKQNKKLYGRYSQKLNNEKYNYKQEIKNKRYKSQHHINNNNDISIRFVSSLLRNLKDNIQKHTNRSQLSRNISQNVNPSYRNIVIPSNTIKRNPNNHNNRNKNSNSTSNNNNTTILKRRSSLQGKKNKLKILNLPQKTKAICIKKYTNYIMSKTDKQYFCNYNFSSIKLLSREQALKRINNCLYIKILENIICRIQQILQNNSNSNKSYKYLKQLCEYFFIFHSKTELQVILCCHIFNSFIYKIRNFFIYFKLTFYHIAIMIQYHLIFQYVQSLIDEIKIILEILSFINKIIADLSMKQQFYLSDTFHGLKLVHELDKKMPIFEKISKNRLLKLIQNSREIKKLYLINECFEELILDWIHTPNKLIEYELQIQLQMKLSWQYLKIPPIPFLPQKQQNNNHKYTCIIGLNWNLVLFCQETKLLKYRPYMDRFFNEIKKYCQLILWNNQVKSQTNIVVNEIQKNQNIFDYQLYKNHMRFKQGVLVKDLTQIGRSIQKIIMIDHNKINIKYCQTNSIYISQYAGDAYDRQLLRISNWISKYLQSEPKDVRVGIYQYHKNLLELQKITQQIQDHTLSIIY